MRWILGLAAAFVLVAQERSAFEAASIHASAPGLDRFSIDVTDSGRLTVRNMKVWDLLRQAYHWRETQMTGGPAWIKSEGFDIEAVPSMPVDRTRALEMLKTLLEERFHIRWHEETREMPAYALKVDAGGAKLPPPGNGPARMQMGNMRAPSLPMEALCQILEFDAGRPVVNQTGLTGPYAIELRYARDAAVADTSLPSLFTAVREQLGLRLESAKLPLKVFVIDDAQRPSEN
ncbi:MAG TPA: TIGR03435 family protein [Bryobacteraceae bacterium]|nr:TIGR03435 family protein [Bryobacteraceae bacterium]